MKQTWGFLFTEKEVILITKKCGVRITRQGHGRYMASVSAEVKERFNKQKKAIQILEKCFSEKYDDEQMERIEKAIQFLGGMLLRKR